MKSIIKLYDTNKKMSRSIGGVTGAAATSPTYTTYITGSGTYTSPTGCSSIVVEMTGGGGSGGVSAGDAGSGCGSSYMKLSVPAGTYSYSVGVGGAGSTTSTGNAGTSTTFGSAICGGGGGPVGNTPGVYGTDTTAYTVLLYIPGGKGSTIGDSTLSNSGGTSFLGSASGYTDAAYVPAFSSFANAGGYGAGGASGTTNFTGTAGSGSNGVIAITEFY